MALRQNTNTFSKFFTVDIVQILLIQIYAAHTAAQQSCQRFQQSRFTGAVRADDSRDLTFFYSNIQFPDYNTPIVADL